MRVWAGTASEAPATRARVQNIWPAAHVRNPRGDKRDSEAHPAAWFAEWVGTRHRLAMLDVDGYIARTCRDWHYSPYSLPSDINLAAHVEMCRIMRKFRGDVESLKYAEREGPSKSSKVPEVLKIVDEYHGQLLNTGNDWNSRFSVHPQRDGTHSYPQRRRTEADIFVSCRIYVWLPRQHKPHVSPESLSTITSERCAYLIINSNRIKNVWIKKKTYLTNYEGSKITWIPKST